MFTVTVHFILPTEMKDEAVAGFGIEDFQNVEELKQYSTFTFIKGNIADKQLIDSLFEQYKPAVVVNLAAQAGVRYSIDHPPMTL